MLNENGNEKGTLKTWLGRKKRKRKIRVEKREVKKAGKRQAGRKKKSSKQAKAGRVT